MNVAYGYQIESENDKFVSLVDEQIALSNSLCVPGKYLVEYIPLCKLKTLVIWIRDSIDGSE